MTSAGFPPLTHSSKYIPMPAVLPSPPSSRVKVTGGGSTDSQLIDFVTHTTSPSCDLSHEQSGLHDVSLDVSTRTFALVLAGLDPDYLNKLLIRPPPPVPAKRSKKPEHELDAALRLLPRRRIPPKPPVSIQSDVPNKYLHRPSGYNVAGKGLYHNPGSDNIATREVAGVTSGMFSAGTCIKCHDFSIVDAHAAQFPRQCVSSLYELTHNLTGPFMYETEKARAIFTWLHHNIWYDTQSFFAGTVQPATPDSTLSSGLAVCDGYSGLFVDLAEKAGLQVYKVGGHGKGFGYQDLVPGEPIPEMSTNHAWNCVLMDGEWRLIDATWGAGVLNGSTYEPRFDPSWFTSTPVEFARRHFPSNSIFQLIADEDGGPLVWEDYILAPPSPVIFNDFYRLGFLVDLLQPASNVIEQGQTVTFTLFKRCEHMTNSESENYIYVLLVPGHKPIPLHPNAEGGWSLTYLVMGKTELSLMFIATIDGRDAKGVGLRGFENALDRKAMSFGGLAKWTAV